MTRILLRYLNSPTLILMVIVGVAIQTSLFHYYPLLYLQPDIVLIAVIWCALRRSFIEGGVLTLIMGEIAEAHSGVPKGLFLTNYMLVYLGLRGLSRYLLIPRLSSMAILTVFTAVFWKLSILCSLALMDSGWAENQWRHTLALLLPGAVMEGIAAIWIYRWLEKFDFFTGKLIKTGETLEDEFALSDEW